MRVIRSALEIFLFFEKMYIRVRFLIVSIRVNWMVITVESRLSLRLLVYIVSAHPKTVETARVVENRQSS